VYFVDNSIVLTSVDSAGKRPVLSVAAVRSAHLGNCHPTRQGRDCFVRRVQKTSEIDFGLPPASDHIKNASASLVSFSSTRERHLQWTIPYEPIRVEASHQNPDAFIQPHRGYMYCGQRLRLFFR